MSGSVKEFCRKKLKHYNIPGHAHALTFSCYHHYDYLFDPTACELFLTELSRSREKHNFQLWAYVLMPSHVHLLLFPLANDYDIASILNDIKGRMAKQFRDFILEHVPEKKERYMLFDKSKKRMVFRFWQVGGGFDRNLRNALAIYRSIKYIEANPVRGGLVSEPAAWQWSSAYALTKRTGLIPDICTYL